MFTLQLESSLTYDVLLSSDKGLVYICHAGHLDYQLCASADWILSCYLPKQWCSKSPFGDDNSNYGVKIQVKGKEVSASLRGSEILDAETLIYSSAISGVEDGSLDNYEPDIVGRWGDWLAFIKLAKKAFLSLRNQGRSAAESIIILRREWHTVPSQYQSFDIYLVYALYEALEVCENTSLYFYDWVNCLVASIQ